MCKSVSCAAGFIVDTGHRTLRDPVWKGYTGGIPTVRPATSRDQLPIREHVREGYRGCVPTVRPATSRDQLPIREPVWKGYRGGVLSVRHIKRSASY